MQLHSKNCFHPPLHLDAHREINEAARSLNSPTRPPGEYPIRLYRGEDLQGIAFLIEDEDLNFQSKPLALSV